MSTIRKMNLVIVSLDNSKHLSYFLFYFC